MNFGGVGSESGLEEKPAPGFASKGGGRLCYPGFGVGRNSLRWPSPLRHRRRRSRRRVLGERFIVAAGGTALRIVSANIWARNPSVRVCSAYGAAWAGDD